MTSFCTAFLYTLYTFLAWTFLNITEFSHNLEWKSIRHLVSLLVMRQLDDISQQHLYLLLLAKSYSRIDESKMDLQIGRYAPAAAHSNGKYWNRKKNRKNQKKHRKKTSKKKHQKKSKKNFEIKLKTSKKSKKETSKKIFIKQKHRKMRRIGKIPERSPFLISKINVEIRRKKWEILKIEKYWMIKSKNGKIQYFSRFNISFGVRDL